VLINRHTEVIEEGNGVFSLKNAKDNKTYLSLKEVEKGEAVAWLSYLKNII